MTRFEAAIAKRQAPRSKRVSRFLAAMASKRERFIEHRGATFRVPPVRKSDGSAAADAVPVSVTVQVAKVEADERFIIGWASVSSVDGVPVLDRQGDVIEDAELEAAAASFMRDHRAGLAMHKGEPAISYTSSLVLTPAIKAALGITTANDRCGWIVAGTVHDDAVWKRVKSGELRSLSIGGTATRGPIT